jgi:DNA repair exonuclease SbcCD ATPase subunit
MAAIIFKTVRWKNFLSTGDQFTEIQLDKSDATLIIGQNGAGKSTLLDALSFGLFGKPFRNILKPQLLNSINNKNAVVEVEFSVGAAEFKIVRGIKPNTFEIYQNGTLINQQANTRDYQAFLEQNVLKLNHKSFHQVVVIGSASFTPFMQLPAGQRRTIIEELLDIQVFSRMNQLLKEKMARLKEQIADVNNQLELIAEKIKLQNRYISDVELLAKDQIRDKQKTIEDNQASIRTLQEQNDEHSKKLELLVQRQKELKTLTSKKQKLAGYGIKFESTLKTLQENRTFFVESTSCPTCSQEITPETRTDHVHRCDSEINKISEGVEKLKAEIESVLTAETTLQEQIELFQEAQMDIITNNASISALQKAIDKLEEDILKIEGTDGDVSVAMNDLKELQQEKESLAELKLSYIDQQNYNNIANEMLKDTGIKTKIVKQYLPVINKLVNQYLQILDFFVLFNLDESFNETIKSRYRDEFTYASFSEGEKQRIDLSLLFTWRQIAKMKNSANTNLLILDETFDSSLDNDGIDNLMKILGSAQDTNVFVISHKGDVLDSKFRNKIEFVKERNFSRIKNATTI